MTPGTILFSTNFEFYDGEQGRKLAVILNDGSCGSYLVAKTTSKQKDKNRAAGCQSSDQPHNFFLPKKTCDFPSDTWILFNEVYEFTLDFLFQEKIKGIIVHKGNLPKEAMCDILLCAMDSQDIDERRLKILVDCYENLPC